MKVKSANLDYMSWSDNDASGNHKSLIPRDIIITKSSQD